MLKDDFEETSDIYFETAKEKIAFLQPRMYLILMDMFKIVRNGKCEDLS